MSKRDLYQKKYEAQFAEWQAKVAGLRASGEKAAAQAQIDLKPHLELAQSRFEAAKVRVQELAAATEDKLEEGAKAVDQVWSEFTAAVEGGVAALKNHRGS